MILFCIMWLYEPFIYVNIYHPSIIRWYVMCTEIAVKWEQAVLDRFDEDVLGRRRAGGCLAGVLPIFDFPSSYFVRCNTWCTILLLVEFEKKVSLLLMVKLQEKVHIIDLIPSWIICFGDNLLNWRRWRIRGLQCKRKC